MQNIYYKITIGYTNRLCGFPVDSHLISLFKEEITIYVIGIYKYDT